MSSIEHNSDDWREIRSRADSIANAVFIVSGGALSLSITVILGNKNSGFITSSVVALASLAWYFLLTALIFFLLLKTYMILQAYLLQFYTDLVNRNLKLLNGIGWLIGGVGFILFVVGMWLMVEAAVTAIVS